MRTVRNALYFALGIALAFFLCAPWASAAGIPGTFWGQVNGIPYTGTTSGNITTYTPTPGSFQNIGGTGGTWGAPQASTGAASWSATAGGGATATRNITLSAGGATATLVQRVKIAAPVVASRVASVARGGVPGLVASVVAAYFIPKGLQWLEAQQQWVKEGTPEVIPRPGGQWTSQRTAGTQYATEAAAVEATRQSFMAQFPQCTVATFVTRSSTSTSESATYAFGSSTNFQACSSGVIMSRTMQACPTGYSLTGGSSSATTCTSQTAGTVPATDADIDNAASQVASGSTAGDAARDVSGGSLPWDLPANTPQEIDTPAPVNTPGKTSSTTDAQGNVTNTTTYQQITFNKAGDTITNQTFTTTINNVTTTTVNGQTQSTTTKPADPASEDPPTFSDPAFPGIGTLYERKYPEGLIGVWNQHKDALLQTSFLQSITSLFNFSAAGSCPSWTVSMNILPGANFGGGDISVPCWIWSAMALVILTTACFTARAIIFGG